MVEGNQVVSNIAKPSLPPPGHCSVVRCGLLPSLKSPGRGPHPAPPCSEAGPPRCPPYRCTFSVTQQVCVVLCANHPDSVLARAEYPSLAAPARLEVTEAESRVRQHQELEGARKGASLEPSEGAQPWDTPSSDFWPPDREKRNSLFLRELF